MFFKMVGLDAGDTMVDEACGHQKASTDTLLSGDQAQGEGEARSSRSGFGISSDPKLLQRVASATEAVEALNILDTLPEQAFDDAVALAASICETPISLVTFLDGRRQWFKAKVGTELTETPISQSFCAHAIAEPRLFMVPDASRDERFRENPLVTGELGMRFYAGVPLLTSEGVPLGTLCVIDTVARDLSENQQTSLARLARQVAAQIKLRTHMQSLAEDVQIKEKIVEQVSSSNDLFSAFMDKSPMVAYIKDEAGRLRYYNRPFAEHFAITQQQWLGKGDSELWPPEFAAKFRQVDLAVLQGTGLVVTEEQSPGPDGSTIHWRTYKFPLRNARGELQLGGMSLDVSEKVRARLALQEVNRQLEQANLRLRELAVTDALTGLANRRAFDQALRDQYTESVRYRRSFSVLLLDVDHFKQHNDRFGHDAGDTVLKVLAAILAEQVRASDLVARYGGEEFAVLLPDSDLSEAVEMAERLCRLIASSPWPQRLVTVSIGAASLGSSRQEAKLHDELQLVRNADQALYQAKARGRNRAVAFEPVAECVAGMPPTRPTTAPVCAASLMA